ncbi:MAG: peptidoglycan recognition family protein [Phormidesmis sp.]
MRRSWLVWITSVIAFLLTAALVVASGPAQEPIAQIKAAVGLPQVEADAESRLSAAGPSSGKTDFTLNGPEILPEVGPKTLPEALPEAALETSPETATRVPETASLPVPDYKPREVVYLADPSNYGVRYTKDAMGNSLSNQYIAVLHETVGSALSAINLFQTPHPQDDDQVSYHTLIAGDGTVVYIVPPEQRAFGAGDSAFQSDGSEETVVTNLALPGSVNNFAYHISLETPPDGRNSSASIHSGYTADQYRSLAWLLSRTSIPDDRITTHKAVDRSGSRIDPRSFEVDRLYALLHQYPNRQSGSW